MTDPDTANGLHKQAAGDYEAAVKHQHKVEKSYDQYKASDAKSNSKIAIDCSNTAQIHSTEAGGMSAE
jgi:hypothetical protein